VESIYNATNTVRANADRNALSIANDVHRGFTDVERSQGVTRLSNERGQGEIRNLIDRNHASILLAQKEGEVENLKAHCVTDKLILDNKFELCQTKDALARQAAENTAAIQLEAFKHKESLARQLAECCCEIKQLTAQQHCEIKEKIDNTASATQLLLRETENQRVRDALQALTTENLVKKFCGSNGPNLP